MGTAWHKAMHAPNAHPCLLPHAGSARMADRDRKAKEKREREVSGSPVASADLWSHAGKRGTFALCCSLGIAWGPSPLSWPLR